MSRLNPATPPESKAIFDAIQKKMGRVPNIFALMGNAPALLDAYMALSKSCEATSISPQTRELIALAVGEANHCQYCLSAHSQIAKGLNLPEVEIIKARRGESNDRKTNAFIRLAKKIVEKKGNLMDSEYAEFKKQGLSDKEILETVLIVTANIFTNYFNHVAATPNDFPEAAALEVAGAL